jgi:hypothetical protein
MGMQEKDRVLWLMNFLQKHYWVLTPAGWC